MQPDPIRLAPPTRPIVFVALAHLSGLLVGFELAPPVWPLLIMIVACLVLASVNWWRSRRIHGPALWSGSLLLLAVAALGAWQSGEMTRGDGRSRALIEPWLAEPALTVSGVVAEPPRIGPDWAEIVIANAAFSSRERTASKTGNLNVAVRLNGQAAAELAARPEALPIPGQSVRALGWLSPITGAPNPSTFDSERYWISRGIGARMNIGRPGQVWIGPEPAGLRGRIEAPLRRLRLAIGNTLDRRLDAGPARLARALVLGQAEMISEDARDAFRLAGWAHLLAISGQNAGIVLLIIIALARVAFIPPKPAAWLAIVGVAFYVALTGFLPPVTRAGIMAIFILTGYALGRQATGPASLALAAIVTLAWDPRTFLRLDWRLSYVCVLSMILIAPPLYEWATRHKEFETPSLSRLLFNRLVILPVAVSTAIQLGLLPLQIACFRQANLLIVISNIFGVFVASLATIGAMATAALGWIPGIGWVVAFLTNQLLIVLDWMAHRFAALPGTSITVPVLAPILIAIFYALLLTGRWLRTGEADAGRMSAPQTKSLLRHLGGAFGFIVIALIWIPLIGPGPPPGDLDLYIVDVGQGDCLVLRSFGRTMVIDSCTEQRGRASVEPFLRELGVDRIDCLVATHADADHIGGMAGLVEHFKVGQFIRGNDTSDSAIYQRLIKDIAGGHVDTVTARPGGTIEGFGQTRIRMLGPVPGLTDNNGSVVLLVEHGQIQFLLMGDLEREGERLLAAAAAIPDVEVLKVGHHGSRSSTCEALLQKCKPELALVSVGANNNFGHPAPEIMDRLDDAETKILRTDQLGAIWLHSTGTRVDVYRYRR